MSQMHFSNRLLPKEERAAVIQDSLNSEQEIRRLLHLLPHSPDVHLNHFIQVVKEHRRMKYAIDVNPLFVFLRLYSHNLIVFRFR